MEWDVLYSLVRNNGLFSVNYFNEENRQGGGGRPRVWMHPWVGALHRGFGASAPRVWNDCKFALAVGIYFLGYTSFRRKAKKGLHYVKLN